MLALPIAMVAMAMPVFATPHGLRGTAPEPGVANGSHNTSVVGLAGTKNLTGSILQFSAVASSCCNTCAHHRFCSPVSGKCYHAKKKNYYSECDDNASCIPGDRPCHEHSECCSGTCLVDGMWGPDGAKLLVALCLGSSHDPPLTGCIPSNQDAANGWRLCTEHSQCCSGKCLVHRESGPGGVSLLQGRCSDR